MWSIAKQKYPLFLTALFLCVFSPVQLYAYNGYDYELDDHVYVAVTPKDYSLALEMKQSGDATALISMFGQGRIKFFNTKSDAQIMSTSGGYAEIRLPGQTMTYWTDESFLKRVPRDVVDLE